MSNSAVNLMRQYEEPAEDCLEIIYPSMSDRICFVVKRSTIRTIPDDAFSIGGSDSLRELEHQQEITERMHFDLRKSK